MLKAMHRHTIIGAEKPALATEQLFGATCFTLEESPFIDKRPNHLMA